MKNYYKKYLKYKSKYIKLKNQAGGYWYSSCDHNCHNYYYWGAHELAEKLDKYGLCCKTNKSNQNGEVYWCNNIYIDGLFNSQIGIRDITHVHIYTDSYDFKLHMKIKLNGNHCEDIILNDDIPIPFAVGVPPHIPQFYTPDQLDRIAKKISNNLYYLGIFNDRTDPKLCFPDINVKRTL